MKIRILAILLMSIKLLSQTITFTFGNSQITGTSPKYFEFDVMVAASTGGTKIGAALAYINYNSTAFGSNIKSNSKVTVTKGSLVDNDFYDLQTNDHASNRLSVAINYLLPSSPTLGSDLTTSATQWAHIKIEIANESVTSGLSFQESLMEGQARQSDNTTAYTDVIASDTEDASLPVQMSSIVAESTREGITLTWITESEVNSRGFHIWRALDESGEYTRITTSLIAGEGNNSAGATYVFTDNDIKSQGQYFYKIQEVAADGSAQFFSPVSAQALFIPDKFAMSQNYPNPFNPMTTFTYDVPEISNVTVTIYNLLGKEVKILLNKQQMPGRYNETWDGVDTYGQKLSSGVYFLRMQAGSFTKMRKMTLLR